MANVKVVGVKELLLKLKNVEVNAPVAFAQGAYDGMQDIMLDAKQQAPKDTSAMAKSGYVTPPEVTKGTRIEIQAGFGGESEAYVVRQHEDLTLSHPNGGNAKFMSNAIDAGRGNLMQKIAAYVKRFLAGGGVPAAGKRVPTTPYEQVLSEIGD